MANTSPAQPQNCPAWQHLQQLAKQFAPSTQAATPQVPAAAHFDLRQAFASNPQRTAQLSLALHDAQGELLYCDYSKAHINGEVLQALLHLAEQTQVSALRDAMFSGAAINTSEQRQVMHWLLRVTDPAELPSNLLALWHEVDTTRRAFLDFAESIRADAQITDIVNIGIGGSDLGPCMAVQALYNHALPNKRLHFVSNIDAHDLQQVLQQVQRQHTLFIIASKSFTTLETMLNARTALDWFCNGEQEHNNGNTPDIARHFVGITTNQQAAAALGIRTTFGFWDWVGGRYSLWSA
ncbi:MAG: glucose-6-phosphate isomerase, partial [Brachymonas sp.]|nr:glucose-6-phosphate isomerase [Brachymonas sp.]